MLSVFMINVCDLIKKYTHKHDDDDDDAANEKEKKSDNRAFMYNGVNKCGYRKL